LGLNCDSHSESLTRNRRALNELVSSNAALILKSNNDEELTSIEIIEAERLISSVYQMLFFTNRRASHLNHPSVGIPEQAFAIFLYENPGVRKLWDEASTKSMRYFDAMGRGKMPGNLPKFHENVADNLTVLDRLEQ
jgi:hypothetical protein